MLRLLPNCSFPHLSSSAKGLKDDMTSVAPLNAGFRMRTPTSRPAHRQPYCCVAATGGAAALASSCLSICSNRSCFHLPAPAKGSGLRRPLSCWPPHLQTPGACLPACTTLQMAEQELERSEDVVCCMAVQLCKSCRGTHWSCSLL